jgi:hypothetical protein
MKTRSLPDHDGVPKCARAARVLIALSIVAVATQFSGELHGQTLQGIRAEVSVGGGIPHHSETHFPMFVATCNDISRCPPEIAIVISRIPTALLTSLTIRILLVSQFNQIVAMTPADKLWEKDLCGDSSPFCSRVHTMWQLSRPPKLSPGIYHFRIVMQSPLHGYVTETNNFHLTTKN